MAQWTPWLRPRIAEYAETDRIQFDNLNTDTATVSLEPCVSVAVSQGRLNTVETQAILYRDFDLSSTVLAAQLHLHVSRLGRTQDRLIRMRDSEGWLSDNLSDLTAEDHHVYTVRDLNISVNSSTGFVIDLGPHTEYPSRNTVYIRSVQARFRLK